MPVPWSKRKERVKAWERKNKEEGRLPYWNDRARFINNNAKRNYFVTETVAGKELMALYEIANRKCCYCSEELTPAQVHFDHVESLKSGGENSISNLCIACYECNTSKQDDSADDWLNRVYRTQTPERIYKAIFERG